MRIKQKQNKENKEGYCEFNNAPGREPTELNQRKFPGHYNRQTAHYGAINV